MLHKTLSDEKFCEMMKGHIEDFLEYLLNEDINFSILVNVSDISFEPPLPKEIIDSFRPVTMFVLAGYTYDSIVMSEDFLSFEAGFGAENYGSLVSLPLLSILQVIVEKTPVLINLCIPIEMQKNKDKGIKKSMEALLSNPENQKFLKK